MGDQLETEVTSVGPIVRHPNRYVWDFWHVADPSDSLIHVFVLNAPLGPDSTHEERNEVARIGHGVTEDFTDIEWRDMDVLVPRSDAWDDVGLWTGGTVRDGARWLMAYTARNHRDPDVQAIGFASSPDLSRWSRTDEPFVTTPPGFVADTDPEERTIHCWRDPSLHRRPDGCLEMVVAAKRRDRPPGHRGTVAFLERRSDGWRVTAAGPPSLDVAELEVPNVLEGHGGGRWLTFSSHDWADRVGGVGGLQAVSLDQDRPRQVLVPRDSGLYACRVIPELDGEIVGFVDGGGGLRRAGVRVGLQLPTGSIIPRFEPPDDVASP